MQTPVTPAQRMPFRILSGATLHNSNLTYLPLKYATEPLASFGSQQVWHPTEFTNSLLIELR